MSMVATDPFSKLIRAAIREEFAAHRAAPPKRLLTIEEAAEYLGVSAGSIKNIVAAGELSPVRQDRIVRYDLRDLDTWIANHKD